MSSFLALAGVVVMTIGAGMAAADGVVFNGPMAFALVIIVAALVVDAVEEGEGR